MARPGLTRHRKFARLARLLAPHCGPMSPDAVAVGHLELIWLVAYENGDDLLGDAGDVEQLARWWGPPGVLAAALVEAGFVDREGEAHRVHDLFHHAPDYVRKRAEREAQRRAKGETVSSLRAKAGRKGGRARAAKAKQVADTCQATGETPAPAPAPAPDACLLARAGASDASTELGEAAEVAAPPPAIDAASEPASFPIRGAPPAADAPAPPPAEDPPVRRRPLVIDEREMGPLGADLRARFERALSRGLVVAAKGREDYTARELEAKLKGWGPTAVDWAFDFALRTAKARKEDPQSVAWLLAVLKRAPGPDGAPPQPEGPPEWAALLKHAAECVVSKRFNEDLAGCSAELVEGELLLTPADEWAAKRLTGLTGMYGEALQRLAREAIPGVDVRVRAGAIGWQEYEAQTAPHWQPILDAMNPEQRTEFERVKAETFDAIRAQHLTAIEESIELADADQWLCAKWSQRVENNAPRAAAGARP